MRISTSGTCFCLFGPLVLQYLLNMRPTSQSWTYSFNVSPGERSPKYGIYQSPPRGFLSNCTSALVYPKQDNIYIIFYLKIPEHFQEELISQISPSPQFVNIFSGRGWISIALSTNMVQIVWMSEHGWRYRYEWLSFYYHVRLGFLCKTFEWIYFPWPGIWYIVILQPFPLNVFSWVREISEWWSICKLHLVYETGNSSRLTWCHDSPESSLTLESGFSWQHCTPVTGSPVIRRRLLYFLLISSGLSPWNHSFSCEFKCYLHLDVTEMTMLKT